MLNNIRIVLVNTSHPGNIGSSARAMKTMGIRDLYLVGPRDFPSPKANELAAGADDILDNATVVDDLPSALKECQLVIASSARPRELAMPGFDPRGCAERVVTEAQAAPVAIVFGREHAGLTNEELLQCHYHVLIPSHPDYHSLNLSQAVQVLCYEVRMRYLAGNLPDFVREEPYASHDEMERFYVHLKKALIDINFLRPRSPKRIMPRLRRLFGRIRLEAMEVQLLRGILTLMEKRSDT